MLAEDEPDAVGGDDAPSVLSGAHEVRDVGTDQPVGKEPRDAGVGRVDHGELLEQRGTEVEVHAVGAGGEVAQRGAVGGLDVIERCPRAAGLFGAQRVLVRRLLGDAALELGDGAGDGLLA